MSRYPDAIDGNGGNVNGSMWGTINITFMGDSNMHGQGNLFEGPRLAISQDLLAAQLAGEIPNTLIFYYTGPINDGSKPTDHHMGESGSDVANWYNDPIVGDNTSNYAWYYFGALPNVALNGSAVSQRNYNCGIGVISIGTNNCNSDVNLALGQATIQSLLQKLLDRNLAVIPWFRLVVGDVVAAHDSTRQARVVSFNASLVTAITALQGLGYRIYHSVGPALVYPDDYIQSGGANDGLHLGPTGQAKWAAALYPTIREALGWTI
jgi:hypothetical protein